jgi:PAS domain S-box-containing protein
VAQLTIRRKVLVAIVGVTVSFGTLLGVAAKHYSDLLDTQAESVRANEALAVLHDMKAALDADRGLLYCASTGNRAFMERGESSDGYESLYRHILELTTNDVAEQQQLAELDHLWHRWSADAIAPLRALCEAAQGSHHPELRDIERLAALRYALRSQLRAQVDLMEASELKFLQSREDATRALQAQTAGLLTVSALFAVILAFITATWLVSAAASQDKINATLEAEVQQRRVAERRVTHSETRVRTILDNVPDGVITIDERGQIESFNPSAEGIFGYRAHEVIGHNVTALMPEPTGSAHDGYIERHIATGEKRVLGRRREVVARRSDGTRFVIDLAVTESWVDGERLFTGIVRDVSESKRRDEEIRRFKTMLDNTLDMIFMFDPVTLTFTYANRGAEETLGYARQEFLHMRASDLTPAMPEHVFRSQIVQLLSGSRPWLSYETPHRCRDGALVPSEVFLQLVRGSSDERGLFIAIVRDLTERRRIDRMKSEFISIIGHELRSPLTSIRGSLGLLMGGAAGALPERAQRMVEIAQHNAERLVRLINDMLDMEKIESGKMRFDMRPLDVSGLVEQSIEANRGYGEQYSVTFSADPIENNLKVYGDFDRLMQVMNNLLSNAAKFSPAEGQVRVRVARRSTQVRISVSDLGPGIPESFRPRVFERFSQADTSDARQKGGTGLGLSICRAIVERHDGLIDFETVPGKGTTFWFELPVWTSPVPQGRTPQGDAPRILVCDQDPDAAHALETMLRDAGYEVDVAYSPEEVRRLLATSEYALLTLDVGLSGDGGLSLMRDMQRDLLRLPPVIAVSARHEDHEHVDGGQAVLDWLEKPIDPTRLMQTVQRALRGRQSRLSILHVEDDSDVRDVLQTLVGDQVEVIGASSVGEATSLMGQRAFDLVVLDVGLPDASGLELLPTMNGMNVHTPVLLFSAHDASAETERRVAAALVKSRTSNQQLLETVRKLVA